MHIKQSTNKYILKYPYVSSSCWMLILFALLWLQRYSGWDAEMAGWAFFSLSCTIEWKCSEKYFIINAACRKRASRHCSEMTDPATLARLHIYYCVRLFWAPQYQKYLNWLGGNRRRGGRYISTPWIKEDELFIIFAQDRQIFWNWNCIESTIFEFSGQNKFKGVVVIYVTSGFVWSSELPLFIQYVVPVACSSLLPISPVPSIISYLIWFTIW